MLRVPPIGVLDGTGEGEVRGVPDGLGPRRLAATLLVGLWLAAAVQAAMNPPLAVISAVPPTNRRKCRRVYTPSGGWPSTVTPELLLAVSYMASRATLGPDPFACLGPVVFSTREH